VNAVFTLAHRPVQQGLHVYSPKLLFNMAHTACIILLHQRADTAGRCDPVLRCECPYGYYGPTCEKEIFPACKLAPEATEMHCGERMPRSCECFRQCRKFYCKGGKGACETPRDPWFVRCFERVKPAGNSSTAAAVYSDVPEEWEEKQGLVAWHRGIRTDLARERLARQKATTVRQQLACHSADIDPCCMAALVLAKQELQCWAFGMQNLRATLTNQHCGSCVQHMSLVCAFVCFAWQVPPLLPGGSAMVALPVSQCPDKCTLRGQCIKSAASPTPRCLCWQGFTGDSCEQVGKALRRPLETFKTVCCTEA